MNDDKKDEHAKKIDEIKNRYAFSFGASRIGRFHALRVFLLALGAMGLAWYANIGAQRFSRPTTITVSGVRDTVAGVIDVSVITEPAMAVWHDADIFGDGKIAARRMMFAGVNVVVIDSVDASLIIDIDSPTPRTAFREMIDLMIVPHNDWLASDTNIVFLRDAIRPKLIALTPPCIMQSSQNIFCICDDESVECAGDGEFSYTFDVRRGAVIKQE